MTEETNILEQIDRYLEGSMDMEESAIFEVRLAADNELASLLEASQLTEQVVIGHEALKIKEQMAKDLAKPKSNVRNYLIGAVLFACIGTGAYFSQNDRKEESASLPNEMVKSTEKTVNVVLPETVPSKGEKKQTTSISPKKVKTISAVGEPTYFALDEATNPKVDAVLETTDEKNKGVSIAIPKTDPCEGVKIEFDYYTTPSCKGESVGEIHVKSETIKGGISPYKFSVNKDANSESGNFSNLSAGTYQLTVKDANECVTLHSKNALVLEKTCTSTKEFSYNPTYDATWSIPYDTNKKPKSIKILDKNGREVFQSNVLDFSPAEWNGESNTGLAIGVGYHLYFIEYADGSIDKGSLTILR